MNTRTFSLRAGVSCAGFLFLFSVIAEAETPAPVQPKAPEAATPAPQPAAPRSVELTSKAWDAHGKNKHEEAVKAAEKCIAAYEAAALKIQEQLVKEKKDLPTGEVTDEEKKTIQSNGPLNDVGACYIIKGLSLVALKKNDEAKEAFKSAVKLSQARVWDPQGWFWSPAETADEELDKLE
jgi:hypothetical protein